MVLCRAISFSFWNSDTHLFPLWISWAAFGLWEYQVCIFLAFNFLRPLKPPPFLNHWVLYDLWHRIHWKSVVWIEIPCLTEGKNFKPLTRYRDKKTKNWEGWYDGKARDFRLESTWFGSWPRNDYRMLLYCPCIILEHWRETNSHSSCQEIAHVRWAWSLVSVYVTATGVSFFWPFLYLHNSMILKYVRIFMGRSVLGQTNKYFICYSKQYYLFMKSEGSIMLRNVW
jgi:hypothetical protein